jgi:hypothetical protein
MALSTVIADVHTNLVSLDAGLAVAQPSPLVGALFLHENCAPPRVVWVPVRSSPGPLNQRQAPASSRSTAPRQLGTRNLSVAAHIWGADPDAAEALLVNVHNAMRLSLGGSYAWTSEEWPQQDGDAIEQLGTLVIVVFELHVPIVEAGQAFSTPPNTLAQTTQMDFPSGSSVAGTPAP